MEGTGYTHFVKPLARTQPLSWIVTSREVIEMPFSIDWEAIPKHVNNPELIAALVRQRICHITIAISIQNDIQGINAINPEQAELLQ